MDSEKPKSSFERRRKQEHSQHEEPPLAHDESNWLVSYADMMTLLFGFFVIIYSMSKIDNEKFVVVSRDIARYFGGKAELSSIVPQTEEKIKEILQKAGLTDETVNLTPMPTGIRLKFNSSVLFDPGSAKLKEEMYPVLSRLVDVLRATQQIEEIKVEGHTDDEPIQSPYFPTNWELSAARAARVLRQVEAGGVPSAELIAEGFGSSRPEKPNRDGTGVPIKENQISNRRVIVNVLFQVNASDKAREQLKTGDFKIQPEIQDKSEEALRDQENSLDTESVLKKKLAEAQERLGEANKRLAETKARVKQKQQLADLEKKTSDAEKKANEAERKIYELNRNLPSQGTSPEPAKK